MSDVLQLDFTSNNGIYTAEREVKDWSVLLQTTAKKLNDELDWVLQEIDHTIYRLAQLEEFRDKVVEEILALPINV